MTKSEAKNKRNRKENEQAAINIFIMKGTTAQIMSCLP